MARTLDLRCPACDETEDDVVLGRDEDLSPCPTCAGPRVISWASGKGPGFKCYQPVFNDATGKYMDETEWKEHRVAVAERQGVPVSEIVAERQTKTEIVTHADEIQHRSAVRKRKQGITADVEKSIKSDVKTYGVNPANGKKTKPNPRKAP